VFYIIHYLQDILLVPMLCYIHSNDWLVLASNQSILTRKSSDSEGRRGDERKLFHFFFKYQSNVSTCHCVTSPTCTIDVVCTFGLFLVLFLLFISSSSSSSPALMLIWISGCLCFIGGQIVPEGRVPVVMLPTTLRHQLQ